MQYKNHITTDGAVVIIFDDGSMKSVDRGNPLYSKIVTLLNDHNFEEIAPTVDLATKIRMYTNGRFFVGDGVVFIGKDALPNSLGSRLIAFADACLPCEPLLKFWENLNKNPSERSKEHLHAFLEHNGIPITKDGCFVAYKRVTEDYLDCHTKTLDNHIGNVVTMDRSKVNEDPNMTCSAGLHVAAFRYAKDMYSNGILLEVKVNPRDVVAVPVDYNGEKMRVCEYTVLRECEGPRDEPLYSDEDYSEDNYQSDLDYDDGYDNGYDDAYYENGAIDPSLYSEDYINGYDDGYVAGTGEREKESESLEEDQEENAEVKNEKHEKNIESSFTDNTGRLRIKTRFIKRLGASAGDFILVSVASDMKKLTLTAEKKAKSDDKNRVYTVNTDGSIRISESLLQTIGNDSFYTPYFIEFCTDVNGNKFIEITSA